MFAAVVVGQGALQLVPQTSFQLHHNAHCAVLGLVYKDWIYPLRSLLANFPLTGGITGHSHSLIIHQDLSGGS